MPPRLEIILNKAVVDLASRQPLKGKELIITGLQPAAGGLGPRYFLKGHGNKPFLRMNSNSYLGLSLNKQQIKAEEDYASRFGTGPGAVRFISGTYQVHLDLERELAKFHHRQAAMLFSSAYAAVIGVLPALISKETVVISDALNHNSIINALRLAHPAAKAIYQHNNLKELEASLKKHQTLAKRAIIITDGIFSMRGDHAPLKEISELRRIYENRYREGVTLVVDDSHGVGAVGKSGRGTEELSGGRADILISTLGKAFGVNGGYITASKSIVNFLRENAALYIYSNPITPAEAAAALAAVNTLHRQAGSNLLKKLRKLSQLLKKGLITLGYETIVSEHPIVPLMIRDTARTTSLVKYLFETGILATGLNFPVVPKGDEEIRFQVNANHTEKDIELVLKVLEEFKKG